MGIRAVVFDIGGVLENTPTTRWQRRWEASLGLEEGEIDARLEHVYRAGTIGTITTHEAEATIASLLQLDDRRLAELMNELWHEYLGSLDVALARWFGALRPRFRTGLLSNSWVGAREREAARYDFGRLCDTIVYSHEEGVEKPDPRAYEIVCERLDVRPREVLFLDDRRANVTAACAIGMHGVVHRGDTRETIAEMEAILFTERS